MLCFTEPFASVNTIGPCVLFHIELEVFMMIGARIARMGGATGDCRGGCGHESRNSWMRHPAFCARESQPRSVREPWWTGLLTSGDQDACVAAAQCIHSFVECDRYHQREMPAHTLASNAAVDCRDVIPTTAVGFVVLGFCRLLWSWPYMEEMVTLVGRLVSHLAHRQGQETVLHAKTAAALATLFRCTPGETLLRRRVQRCAGCECATSVDTGQRFV